jgi:peptidoglycan hydrolase-like protein with peptidoglycan-binding domain
VTGHTERGLVVQARRRRTCPAHIVHDKIETVKSRQTKLAALGQDTGGVDGRYHDKTKIAVQAVAAGSDGMRIGGVEAAQIDVKLGPEARGGVSHQHDECSAAGHSRGG